MGYTSPVVFVEIVGLYTGCENSGLDNRLGSPLAVIKGGVCVDASPAAYRYGVRLDMTRRQAALICPSLVFAGYCEGKYAAPSRRFLETLYKHSPLIEPIGYHQAFMGLSDDDNADSILREIMAELSDLAFIVLVGIGRSKLVARAAAMIVATTTKAITSTASTVADGASPAAAAIATTVTTAPADTANGVELRLIHVKAENEFLEQLPVSLLWKTPEAVRRKLEALGIRTVGHLRRIPQVEIVKQFGRAGYELSRLAEGMDDDPINPAYPPPEITVRATFDGGAGSTDIVEKRLETLCAQISEELREMGCAAGGLRLEVMLANGQKIDASRVFPHRKCSAGAMKTGAWACFAKMAIHSPIERITVTAGDLGKMQNMQAHLPFALPFGIGESVNRGKTATGPGSEGRPPNRPVALPLEQAISALSRRYEKDIIFRGGDLKPSRREEVLSIWDPVRLRGVVYR